MIKSLLSLTKLNNNNQSIIVGFLTGKQVHNDKAGCPFDGLSIAVYEKNSNQPCCHLCNNVGAFALADECRPSKQK